EIAALSSAPPSSFAKPGKPVNIDKVIAAHRRDLTSRINIQYQIICDLEIALDIDDRWTPDHPEWQKAAKLCADHELQEAVDNLKHLCVARLLELKKLLQNNIV
ncbi:hypothetical protein FRC07_014155, partial [Ceratobasidium sp. 392]